MELIMSLLNRAFLNPFLVITGILTLTTGLLLFFHMKSSLIAHTHEIGSLFFAAACLLHLVLNWKPLLHSMKGRLPGKAIAALLVITTAIMVFSWATAEPGKGYGRGKLNKRQHSSAQTLVVPDQG